VADAVRSKGAAAAAATGVANAVAAAVGAVTIANGLM